MLEAVAAAGVGFTTTLVVVATVEVHPPTVICNEYVPAFTNAAEAITGFCTALEKLFGPVQEYVAPATVGAVKLIGFPWQTGELLETAGAVGAAFTTTEVLPADELHPVTVTVTL